MDMMLILTYIMTAVALAGSILNARKLRIGFVFWIVSNSYLIVRNLFIGEYAQAILFVVNTAIAVYGFIKWTRSYRELDRFFVNPNRKMVNWVYYNPGSESGRQYVTNYFSFDTILEAEINSYSTDEFFDYIRTHCKQYFSDGGTREFKADDCDHRKKKADYTGADDDTMMVLVALADKEKAHG